MVLKLRHHMSKNKETNMTGIIFWACPGMWIRELKYFKTNDTLGEDRYELFHNPLIILDETVVKYFITHDFPGKDGCQLYLITHDCSGKIVDHLVDLSLKVDNTVEVFDNPWYPS